MDAAAIPTIYPVVLHGTRIMFFGKMREALDKMAPAQKEETITDLTRLAIQAPRHPI